MPMKQHILQNHFEHFLDILPDGVYISDVDGTTLHINKMYEKLTGLKQDELVGKNVLSLVKEGIFDQVVNPAVVKTKKPATHVQQLANGKRLVLNGFPVLDHDGKLVLVVTFARDITMLTQMHGQMLEQRKSIEQFHDCLAFITQQDASKFMPVSASESMQKVIDMIERFAQADATVLLLGETGVGKDVMARLLHDLSPRKSKMFLKVDCGGIAEGLTESELFGYMPGAFTGAATKGKSGYFEMADGGTVFLDEIGELSLGMQTRLLRVLQDGEIMRVGASTPRKVNVRIVAATNRDLAKRVEEGLFRSDLYYRLNVASLTIPPLRERPDDIPPLIEHFLQEFAVKYRKEMTLGEGVMDAFIAYAWPGNVRELQNMLHSLVITRDQGLISIHDLPHILPTPRTEEQTAPVYPNIFQDDRPLKDIMADIERTLLTQAMEHYGSVNKVAERFGINRSTLFRKLQEKQ